MSRCCRVLAVGVSVLALALPGRATIVVDAAGGGQFTSLEAAIAAAADGEQILVKSGTYLPSVGDHIVIDGKGLSLVAEAGATVVLPGLKVTGLPDGLWVIARGLTLDPSLVATVASEGTLAVSGAGSVWLEDCTVTADKGQVEWVFLLQLHPPGAAVDVQAGASVTLQQCTLTGGDGYDKGSFFADKWAAGPGAPGVRVAGGSVALHGCTVTGGNGGDGEHFFFTGWFPPDGGAGVLAYGGGLAHVAGSLLTGGSNGLNSQILNDSAGDGLYAEGAGTQVWLRDSELQPGIIVNEGQPGQPLDAFAGLVTEFTAPARSLTVTSPLREGQPGVLSVQGQPGDLVLLLVALGAGHAPLAGKQGVFALDTSVLLLPVVLGGISDPGGTLALPFVTPSLNPALLGLTVPMQLAVANGGVATLEAGTALAWLDGSL